MFNSYELSGIIIEEEFTMKTESEAEFQWRPKFVEADFTKRSREHPNSMRLLI
jgi:hypothetical protein